MNRDDIKTIALAMGFKLKEQPNGEMDLNPYVYEFAAILASRAINEAKEATREKLTPEGQPWLCRVADLEAYGVKLARAIAKGA